MSKHAVVYVKLWVNTRCICETMRKHSYICKTVSKHAAVYVYMRLTCYYFLFRHGELSLWLVWKRPRGTFKRNSERYIIYFPYFIFYLEERRDAVLERLTRHRSIMSSSTNKGSHCFIEQDTLLPIAKYLLIPRTDSSVISHLN